MRSINIKKISFLLGPLFYFLIQTMPIENLSDSGKAVLAGTVWIAFWWITETVDLVITSLLPIVIFPLSGALTIGETTSSYGNPFIFLFLGGFIMGIAIEHWNLHKRIAYKIIQIIGTDEKRILLGLMLATAFLSMWISNTATTIMMLPVGLSVIGHFNADSSFSKNILLGIAYAASIGGITTLIGTPPNIILAGVMEENLGMEISFLKWMIFALPLVTVLFFITYKLLVRKQKTSSVRTFKVEDMGEISLAEKRILYIVGGAAFFWITRSFIWNYWLPFLDDTIIAIGGAILMLVVPSGVKDKNLISWESADKIPWNVLILFGAGLAIAKGFSSTDLTDWLGSGFANLEALPNFFIVIFILISINFLTEITSNTATASILLPILFTLSISLNIETGSLLAGAALASSCAFMLPVATPPNAIVFSSGKLKIKDMMKTGILLNLISTFLIYLSISFLWKLIF